MGITRQTVIEIAETEGIPVHETTLTAFDLFNADEVFFSSTAGGIFAVVEVDGRKIGSGEPGPLAARFRERYYDLLESGEQSAPAY
jgi:branched-chain amino acid aminotransferase